jgi:hypothetical protein
MEPSACKIPRIVSTADLSLKNRVFWNVMLCSWAEIHCTASVFRVEQQDKQDAGVKQGGLN